MRKKNPRRLPNALLKVADDTRRIGILDPATHEKITLHHPGGYGDMVTCATTIKR
jgi:hypothetical protein